MSDKYTLSYVMNADGWYIGWLKEKPSVSSQGRTLRELKINIQDALDLMTE